MTGLGIRVQATGDHITEGLVERILLGRQEVPLGSVTFSKTGFNFITTTKILSGASNRLTVITRAGEDSATIQAAAR